VLLIVLLLGAVPGSARFATLVEHCASGGAVSGVAYQAVFINHG
jgi:hypothetical protein